MPGYTKIVIITRAADRNDAFLAQCRLRKGYSVHGLKRPSPLFNASRIDQLYLHSHERGVRSNLHDGDLTDAMNLFRLVPAVRLGKIDNLRAESRGFALTRPAPR